MLAFSRWLSRFGRLSRFSGLLAFSRWFGRFRRLSRFSGLSRLGGWLAFSRRFGGLRRLGRFSRLSRLGGFGRLSRLRRFGRFLRFSGSSFGFRFRSWLGLRRRFWLGFRRGFWFWFGLWFWLRLWCRLGFFGRGLLGLPFLLAPLPKQALFLGLFGLGKDHIIRGQRILRPRLESSLHAVVQRHGAQRGGCHQQADCGSCQKPW
ncbi:hypothetical protein [Allomesorhizobium alhagi]|uniref:Uncharacterized protein n=1 Tax=Mesorhizobium alhagi CCNWXJ12-2 TaxID=1107882 RepID=H0HPN5_9HYPH|nr:hypothetical protein MAXJ12_10573 [Mesorhizobium alhagi CCNWXJ12-2]